MISLEFRAAILASAVLAAVAVWRSRGHIREQWDISASAVFVAAWLLNTRHLAAAVTGDFYVVQMRSALVNSGVVYGPTALQATRVSTLMLLIAAVVLLLRGLGLQRKAWNPAGLVAVLLAGVVLLCTWWNAAPIDLQSALTVFAILSLAVVLPPGSGARLGAAMYGASLTIVSALLLAFRQDSATRMCGAKCSDLGVLYTGAFVNENAFGLSLAIALPFVLTSLDAWRRWAVAAAIVVAGVGSESRTAQFAIAVTVVVFVLTRGRYARGIALGSAVGLALVALIVPFATTTAGAFTGRQDLWSVAITRWGEQWFVGYGAGAWAQARQYSLQIGAEGLYSPHNQWLDLLYAGGILAAGVFAALLVVIYRTAHREDQVTVCLVIVSVMAVGVLERAWTFAGADWMFWSVLAGCLAGKLRTPKDESSRSRHVQHGGLSKANL